jgi:mono/diheme cytochrome c family protein
MSVSHRSEWGSTLTAVVVAAAVVAGLRFALVRDPGTPNAEFLPEMVRGAAWQSQFDGAPTSDGLSDQALVEGVVPRGMRPFRYAATPDDAVRAGRELTNPFVANDRAAADPAAAERGAVVFARFCVPCHGADGEGEGAAVRRGMLRPPSLKADRALQLKDGQLFHILTKGQGNMASYAVQIAPDDRWKAILHVRRLQAGAPR